MNKERLLELAAVLDGTPDEYELDKPYYKPAFAMHSAFWLPNDYNGACGTGGCIAGHAVLLFGDAKHIADMHSRRLGPGEILLIARNLLDIGAGANLFAPYDDDADYTEGREQHRRFISAARAGRVLRRFAETGKVDWTIA